MINSPPGGLEPPTFRLTAERANWLRHEGRRLCNLQCITVVKKSEEKQIYSKMMNSPPGGLEPPTFRLTAERANRLRHGGRS